MYCKILLGLLAATFAGCNNSKTDKGVWIKDTTDGGVAVAGKFESFTTSFSTDSGVIADIEGPEPQSKGNPDFSVYLSPPFDSGETVSGSVIVPEFEFVFEDGWAYFSGANPVGKTKHVKAVGSGTRFVMENGEGGVVRIYLIPEWWGHQVDVYYEGGPVAEPPKIATLTVQGTYVEVDASGVAGSIQPITGDELEFIAAVAEAIGTYTSLPWPWLWP